MKTRLFSFLIASLCMAPALSFARDRDDEIKTCLLELENIAEEFSRKPMDFQRGLVTYNVAMTTTSLIEAYLRGIFPWITGDDGSVFWYNPKMRGILPIDKPIEEIIPARDLQFIRNAVKKGYVVTHNQAFERTMQECAKVTRYESTGAGKPKAEIRTTWIKEKFLEEYPKLFRMGKADSYEVWNKGNFVGGAYGVDIGGRFSGESMCSLEPNAAKLAVHALILDQQAKGRTWIDTQQVNGFLGPLRGPDGKPLLDANKEFVNPGWGAIEIPREKFEIMVQEAEQAALPIGNF
jgi:leucyl/phenylalanyl-tRNA--protein transferase